MQFHFSLIESLLFFYEFDIHSISSKIWTINIYHMHQLSQHLLKKNKSVKLSFWKESFNRQNLQSLDELRSILREQKRLIFLVPFMIYMETHAPDLNGINVEIIHVEFTLRTVQDVLQFIIYESLISNSLGRSIISGDYVT